jgi:hypothetical protein
LERAHSTQSTGTGTARGAQKKGFELIVGVMSESDGKT